MKRLLLLAVALLVAASAWILPISADGNRLQDSIFAVRAAIYMGDNDPALPDLFAPIGEETTTDPATQDLTEEPAEETNPTVTVILVGSIVLVTAGVAWFVLSKRKK